MKDIKKDNRFNKYLTEVKKNWFEFKGYGAGSGTLSKESSLNFISEYKLDINKFRSIDAFFIGVWAISMDRNGLINISV